MKHKVGDKVRIRTDLKKYIKYGVCAFTDEMCTLSGKVVTISGVFSEDGCYFVEEDKNHFFWTDEMFEDSIKATKELGKIIFAEYGILKGLPNLIGLQLGFSIGCKKVDDGGKYTVNVGTECKREDFGTECKREDLNREETITESIEKVNQILKDAKVNYVSELLNKPVEVTIENNTFKDFRILTEIL